MPTNSLVPETPLEQKLNELSHLSKINDFYLTENDDLAYKLNGLVYYDRLQSPYSELLHLAKRMDAAGKDAHGREYIVQGDYGLSLNQHRYRVNIMKTLGRYRWVLRLLPQFIPEPENIGCPQHVVDLLMNMTHGLILLVGPTGSGKSTTIASLINYKARRTQQHVITLEDPVEYIYEDNVSSRITQREVGEDLDSFANGIRAALRQSPDIVMVGEIRDAITAEAALQLSETGHIVISTLHSNSADQTVQRFLKLIPPERLEAAQSTLADVLRIVMCQKLLPTRDGEGRVAVHELMIQNPGIAAQIRKGKYELIQQDIQTGLTRGQLTWERSIKKFVDEGLVDDFWLTAYAAIKEELPPKDESPVIVRKYDMPEWAAKRLQEELAKSARAS